MRRICCGFGVACGSMLLATGDLLAQQAESGGPGEVIKQIGNLDTGQLTILLIFGTGFVAALLHGVASVIVSMRKDVPNGARLRNEIAALEDRVATLEQAAGLPVAADKDSSAPR